MTYCVFAALALLMSIALGWSIGANDAANSLGTAVGARVVTLRQAIVLIAVFGFLGALLQGEYVTRRIGKGIVPLDLLDPNVAATIALAGTFAACVWVVIATYLKMPVSTSHSIVGAIAGGGLAVHAPVKWAVLKGIFLCWVLTPLGSAVLAFLLFHLMQWALPRILPARAARPVLTWLTIASGCYVAYSWGANDVANATGLLAGAGLTSPRTCIALGGLAIVLGIVTWGYKVIETIGTQITHLVPLMAFTAQLASSINVHVYTLAGIPVSTSHSIVGAIFGVGLVRGSRLLNTRILREITICWLATPLVSGLFSYAALRVLRAASVV